jgi:predicted TIM-barrel fold metal-dependent hydrolase
VVDPLGISLVDRIGVDKVMWSTDFPHNESTFGYSNTSLKSVVDVVGPEAGKKIASDNAKAYLGLNA